jgi:hypothetical protein
MSAEPIEVIVFAAPGRDEAHRRCYASIEASDIGKDYVVRENPPNVVPREHWRQTHRRAACAKSEFALVLEDDCLVNKHILHNCRTWPATRDGHFTAGWLYSPGGLFSGKDEWYNKGMEWHGTVAVLYRTEKLGALVEAAWNWMIENDSAAWDIAISRAILVAGLGLRVHGPCLAEHMIDVPSAVGNADSPNAEYNYFFRTTRGYFDGEWKRE